LDADSLDADDDEQCDAVSLQVVTSFVGIMVGELLP